MGVLENFVMDFFFVPLVPPLAHRKNVYASDNDGCGGIVVFMFEQYEL